MQAAIALMIVLHAAAASPVLSMLEIVSESPVQLTQEDRRLLERSCVERLPELLRELPDHAAKGGPYEATVVVKAIEPVAEHLDQDAAKPSMIRARETLRHALLFWDGPPLTMPNPTLLVVPAPKIPDLEMGPFPLDARVPIEVFRKRGRRFICRIEIQFEDHGTHATDRDFEHIQSMAFERTVQWGQDPEGRSVTRVIRHPMRWSLAKSPADEFFLGAQPAVQLLRLQLSPFTDETKKRLFEEHGKRFGHRDTDRMFPSLRRLDAAENAIAITVGRIWLLSLAEERGRKLSDGDLRQIVDLDAPGVQEMSRLRPSSREGARQLVADYAKDPMAMVAKLGPMLERPPTR